MENVNIILAANILKYRKKIGLSQDELAQKLGVTFQAVSKWENAKAAPDITFLPIMADVFECSIDDLFSYMPKSKREALNILPGDSVPEGMKKYIGDQVKYQLDHNGSTDKFLEIMAENLSGNFELTDENIERLLDAYREMYKGVRNKKKI
jgi:transcriptional regulator with XRE-family HTH domain